MTWFLPDCSNENNQIQNEVDKSKECVTDSWINEELKSEVSEINNNQMLNTILSRLNAVEKDNKEKSEKILELTNEIKSVRKENSRLLIENNNLKNENNLLRSSHSQGGSRSLSRCEERKESITNNFKVCEESNPINTLRTNSELSPQNASTNFNSSEELK